MNLPSCIIIVTGIEPIPKVFLSSCFLFICSLFINDHGNQAANCNTYTRELLINNDLIYCLQPLWKVHLKSLRIKFPTTERDFFALRSKSTLISVPSARTRMLSG